MAPVVAENNHRPQPQTSKQIKHLAPINNQPTNLKPTHPHKKNTRLDLLKKTEPTANKHLPMTSFETQRTYTSLTSCSASSADSNNHASNARVNPWTGRPLRNTSFGGRHSNDWLFGSVAVKKSIKKGVKRVLHHE